jgi:hypothetical protein
MLGTPVLTNIDAGLAASSDRLASASASASRLAGHTRHVSRIKLEAAAGEGGEARVVGAFFHHVAGPRVLHDWGYWWLRKSMR